VSFRRSTDAPAPGPARFVLPIVVSLLWVSGCGAATTSPSGASAGATTTTDSGGAMPGMNHGSAGATDPGSMDMGSMDMGSTDTGTMAGMDHGPTVVGDGTKPELEGFKLVVDTAQLSMGAMQPFRFKIVDAKGAAVKDYAVEQTKQLHMIVVRRDLTGYQHVHPILGSDGSWSTTLDVPAGGTWRVIADVVPMVAGVARHRLALGSDIVVSGPGTDRSLPASDVRSSVDGDSVLMDGAPSVAAGGGLLRFSIGQNNKPVAGLLPYLGAYGHLVALRVDDLAYTHLHPLAAASTGRSTTSTIEFMAKVPTPGTYRLFLQYDPGDGVHTSEFTVEVKA